MNLGWWLKSASIMMTKLPVAKLTMGFNVSYITVFPGAVRLTPVDIGSSQSELPSSFLEDNSVWVCFLQLSGDVGGAVWTAIVDDDDLVVKLTVKFQC